MDDIIKAIPEVIEKDKNIHFVLIVPQDTKKKAGIIRSTLDEQEYKHILDKYDDNITWIPGAR